MAARQQTLMRWTVRSSPARWRTRPTRLPTTFATMYPMMSTAIAPRSAGSQAKSSVVPRSTLSPMLKSARTIRGPLSQSSNNFPTF